MFRSLFIGFLILSAIASRGAGIQIDQNTAIPAGSLLDIYNAAIAYAEKQAGFSDAKRNDTAVINASRDVISIEQLLRSAGNDVQMEGILSGGYDGSHNEQFKIAGEMIPPSCMGDIHSCGSDTSPPFRG